MNWAPGARRDLQAISEFLRRENPVAAAAVIDAIDRAGMSLGEHPFKGHPGPAGTWEWVVPRFRRYLLIYDLDERARTVTILCVWHPATLSILRNPPGDSGRR